MSRSPRTLVLAGVLCLAAIVALFWVKRDSEPVTQPNASQTSVSEAKPLDGNQGKGIPSPARPATRRETISTGPDELESILTDDRIDDGAAALKLQEMVAQETLPLEKRKEALEHAVLLTPEDKGQGLVELARNSSLPQELASVLLEEFQNRPDPTRLAGAIALAKNSDSAIREEALELVRFLMDDGESEETPSDEEILKKAESRLPPQERE